MDSQPTEYQYSFSTPKSLTTESGIILHPYAIGLGVIGFIIIVLIVTTSSHQREKLKYLAQKAIRKKNLSKITDKDNQDNLFTQEKLPGFAKTAAESGNTRILKRWIHSKNCDPNSRSDENMTALHYACQSGHIDCIKLLLENGAFSNAIDERRISPLHLAALGGHGLAVKLLLDYNADPFMADIDNHNAFDLAESSGNFGCSRLLQRAMTQNQNQQSTQQQLKLRVDRTSELPSNNV